MATAPLFGSQNGYSTFEDSLTQITKEIQGKDSEYILNVDVEEWRQYFITKYEFIPLTVCSDQITVSYKGKTELRNDQSDRIHSINAYNFEISIPFTGSSFLLFLKPSSCYLNHPQVDIPNGNGGLLIRRVTLRQQDPNLLEREKADFIETLNRNSENMNSDVKLFNAKIARHFNQTYNNKKQEALKERRFFESLNIHIDQSTDKIFKVPIAEKKKIPEPVIDKKGAPKFSKDTPSLPDKFYDDVLEIIYTFYKAVEKKPATYKVHNEEGLRDYVLPTLETRYNNATVTGETFNKGGKTDILVKYKDNTNLFVAECKFWGGEALLKETINQLFDRYLTWRDSKTAIVLFVQNKEFSKVLAAIQDAVRQHPYFVKETGSRGESSFSYVFHFPTDENKMIYMEIMAFHFPS